MSDNVFWYDLTHALKPISHGEGVYLYDTDGKQYLDGASSVVVTNIGHGNKRVAETMAEQAGKLAYAPHHVFSNAPMLELAERLARFTLATSITASSFRVVPRRTKVQSNWRTLILSSVASPKSGR